MKKNNKLSIFLNGLFKENPTFVIFLGMCPALGITTKIENAVYMSLCVLFVLFFSNVIISSIRKLVPNEVRIPVYIIIIATLVSVVDMLFHAFLPYDVYAALGSFISLIVVNCIILGRAEAYASKNTVVDSIFDALGYAAGFAMAIIAVSLFRELIGSGTLSWGGAQVTIIPKEYTLSFFATNAGAFVALGLLVGLYSAIINAINASKTKKAKLEEVKK